VSSALISGKICLSDLSFSQRLRVSAVRFGFVFPITAISYPLPGYPTAPQVIPSGPVYARFSRGWVENGEVSEVLPFADPCHQR
jgi:hypothetical protein